MIARPWLVKSAGGALVLLAGALGVAWFAAALPHWTPSQPEPVAAEPRGERPGVRGETAFPPPALVPWFRDPRQPLELLVQPNTEYAARRRVRLTKAYVPPAHLPWVHDPWHRRLPAEVEIAKMIWPRPLDKPARQRLASAVMPWPREIDPPQMLHGAPQARDLAATPWMHQTADAADNAAVKLTEAQVPPWTHRLVEPTPVVAPVAAEFWMRSLVAPALVATPVEAALWTRSLDQPTPVLLDMAAVPSDGWRPEPPATQPATQITATLPERGDYRQLRQPATRPATQITATGRDGK